MTQKMASFGVLIQRLQAEVEAAARMQPWPLSSDPAGCMLSKQQLDPLKTQRHRVGNVITPNNLEEEGGKQTRPTPYRRDLSLLRGHRSFRKRTPGSRRAGSCVSEKGLSELPDLEVSLRSRIEPYETESPCKSERHGTMDWSMLFQNKRTASEHALDYDTEAMAWAANFAEGSEVATEELLDLSDDASPEQVPLVAFLLDECDFAIDADSLFQI
jgi:hypothetical protein